MNGRAGVARREARKQTTGGDGREVDGLFRSLDPKRRVRIDTLWNRWATLAKRKRRWPNVRPAFQRWKRRKQPRYRAAADLKVKEAALAELLRTQAETEAKTAALRLKPKR